MIETTRHKHELHFIVAALFIAAYISYLIYSPFLYDFLIAACAAAIMKPLYYYLQKKTHNHRNLSASICTILLIIIILGPTALLVTSITSEAFATANFIRTQIQSGNLERLFQFQWQQYPWVQDSLNFISQYVDINTIDLKGPLADQISNMSLWIYQQGTELLTSISLLLLHLFFILLMFYFLLRDSTKILELMSKFTPISKENEVILTQKFTDVSEAILKGTFLTAMVQGVILGTGFALLGLPGPFFWGFVTTFFALMPLGTVIVWLPASIILLVSGSYLQGIILLVWGAGIVSTVDNFLRPLLMKEKAHLPGIVIFFAVIGAINAFGTMGIIIGPMVTVLIFTLLEMYGQKIRHVKNSKMNGDEPDSVLTA